jgi:hypothetical protein
VLLSVFLYIVKYIKHLILFSGIVIGVYIKLFIHYNPLAKEGRVNNIYKLLGIRDFLRPLSFIRFARGL